MPVIPYKQCRVCHGPQTQAINDLLLRGTPLTQIEKTLRAEPYNFPIKYESVGKHLARCLNHDIRNLGPMIEEKRSAILENMTPEQKADFAILVHDRALEELQAGRIKVSTKDGLSARALLDRREEKKEDRLMVMNLARLLSGAGGVGPQYGEDGNLIEGEFIDVTPHENPMLAPASVREPVG